MIRYDLYPRIMIKSFRDVIQMWPGGLPQFAADAGVNENHAKQMRKRNSIAAQYWTPIARRAKAHGLPVTEADLARIKANMKKTVSSKKRQSGAMVVA